MSLEDQAKSNLLMWIGVMIKKKYVKEMKTSLTNIRTVNEIHDFELPYIKTSGFYLFEHIYCIFFILYTKHLRWRTTLTDPQGFDISGLRAFKLVVCWNNKYVKYNYSTRYEIHITITKPIEFCVLYLSLDYCCN